MMRAKSIVFGTIALVVVGAGLAWTWWDGPVPGRPHLGDALDVREGDKVTFDVAPRSPGQEIILFLGELANDSDAPLTLQSLSLARAKGLGEAVELVRAQALIRGPDMPLGSFVTFPLVSFNGEGEPCSRATPSPLEGFRLEPGDQASIGLWLRMLAPGKWALGGQQFTYSQGGRTYQQDGVLRAVTSGRVTADVLPRLDEYQLDECQGDFEVLPGWK
jgi:hypothetical protein